MNEYDDLIANPSQPAPGQSSRVGFSVALDANPDEYAEARRVAQRTGVPVDTALNMPKEIKKRARMGEIDFDSMAVTSPATAKLLADIDLAKMSHDDVDNLSGFEQAARFLKNSGKALASGVPKFNEGMWGVLQAGGEALPSVVGDPIAGFAKEQRGYSKYNADQLLGKADGNLEAGWNSGLQSLGNNLLQLPLAIFGGATPLLTSMGLSTGGGAYGQARDQGLDRGRAFSFGATQGMIEVGTEMIGMPALLSMLKPGAFGKKALEYLYKDQFGEQIATHTQDLNEWASLPENKDKTFADYLAARPDAAIQTAIATAVGGGGQVAVMKAIEAVANRGAQREQEAQQAGQMGELLTGMTKLAEASKLRERDVETAQGFFQSVLDEGRDSVFITPEALAQSGLAEQIAQAIPAVAEQMQTASETGHDIRLPIAELMATMAGPELAQSIIPHVAVDPGGFTPTTAQEYMQSDKAAELQAEVEKILGEKQVDDTFKASAEIVKSRIISELTATTRWDAAKNEADATIYSAYYAVRAAQLGVTPETLYDQRRVNFSDTMIAGDQYGQGKSLQKLRDQLQASQADLDAYDGEIRGGVDPDGDKYFGLADKVTEAMDSFTADLEKIPDDAFALQAKTKDGRMLLVNPSAQKPGHYQLTRFGSDGLPWGDTQYPTKKQAIKDFLDESDAATVKDFGGQLNQSARLNTDTPEFRNWFGESKVVDESGKPLRVFHGTRNEFSVFDYSRIGEQGRAEGAGFYFTNSKDVASGYGKPMEVHLSIKNPMAYDAKPFKKSVIEKIVKRVAELEAQADGVDIGDGFLSNFGDVNYQGLNSVVKEAANLIAADNTALDQLSGIVGSGVNPAYVNQATRDITGYDGVVANGFSNGGDSTNKIFVAFFPEQIKSVNNRGTFDANDPNILHQSAKNVEGSTDRVVDMFGNGNRVQYFNDKKGIFIESQKYPTGKVKWRAGEVIDGLNQWFSAEEFDSKEAAEKSIRGYRAKERSAQKYGDIPNLWRGEEKKVSKAIIDAGLAIDRFSSSTQSKSKYIYLENGLKIRLSDHSLPIHYDSPDIDFRYGDNIKALVDEIKKASESAPTPYSAATRLPGALDHASMQERPEAEPTQIESGAGSDGKVRPATNANGQRIAQTAEGLRNFWSWFGESKVVDESGKPIVVYHGTKNDFSIFFPDSHFGTKDQADSILSEKRGKIGKQVMPVYLSIQKMKRVKDQEIAQRWADVVATAKRQGYDGLIYKNEFEGDGTQDSYVVFKPEQIKSAIGNNGQFDANDQNILHQSGRHPFAKFTRKQFLGSPKITSDSNAKDLIPSGGKSLDGVDAVAFAVGDGLSAKYSETGAAVFDEKGNVIASYSFGDTLVVNKKFRRQGIGEELVYQWRMRNPEAKTAATRTKKSQALQEKVWSRIERELNQSQNGTVALDPLAVERLYKFLVAEPLVDGASLDTKNLANVLEGVTGLSEPERVSGLESLSRVLGHVRVGILHDSQILDSIVELIPVDVVDNLFGSKDAAKVALHDEAMLKDASAFNAELLVSGGGNGSSPVGLHIRDIALLSAKMLEAGSPLYSRRESAKGLPAKVAGEGDALWHDKGTPRAKFNPSTLTVTLLSGADFTSSLHEGAHFFFENDIFLASNILTDADIHGYDTLSVGEKQILLDVSKLMDWHGIQGDITEQLRQWANMDFEEKRTYHERTAESFERYLFEGKAPSIELQPYFQRFAAWWKKVYTSMKDFLAKNPEAGKLNPEITAVFDRMLATTEQIQLAEQGRSMMPLFRTQADAANIGMTSAEFEAYQHQDVDATNTAIEQLQARGLRDMQWIHNARGRVIKQLQKESAAKRAEVQMEARAEIMSQPIYRAWAFLTGRMTADDKVTAPKPAKSDPNVLDETVDSLFVAIAKLGGIKKDDVVTSWGVDPKDKPTSGLFGKPLWRVDGGLSIDGMAEALSQYGYLEQDENGKWDIRELENKFKDELGGDTQFSNAYDYAGNQAPGKAGEEIANPDAVQAGRLSRAALEEMGLPVELINHMVALKMVAKEGWHPDMIAERFAFESGDDMVRRIAAAESPKDAINGLTDQRMLERFGDLSSQEAIDKAADKAIHNEVRARMMATELNALENALGKRKTLASAAKEYATAMIGRVKVRDLKPGQYASAEARALKAAQVASKAGDIAKAAAEQRNALINNYATRAAHDAQDSIEKLRRDMASLANRSDDKLKKSYDMDLVNAVRAILGEYGIAEKKAKRAIDYLEVFKQNDPDMYAVISDAVENASRNAKPYKDLTVEDARALGEEVAAILHLAKRSRQMEVDGDMIDRQEVEDALHARLVALGIPEAMPGDGSAITAGEVAMQKFRTAVAALTRVESWVGKMDGADTFGPFRRYVFGRVKNAADAYRSDKAKYLKQFSDLFDSIKPTLKPAIIAAPELGYTFGKDAGGSAINEIVHAILHTGNTSNKRKLLLGRGWAQERPDGSIDTSRWDAFIQRMADEGKITKAHFDFAQGVWDLLESTKPLAQKTHRDVFGKYFDEVTADQLNSPFGLYAGGYVPAMADSRIVADANMRALSEAENQSMQFAFPTTAKGFTKGRVEYNAPLMLDLRTLSQHIDKVLMFSHLEMPVRDVQRVMKGIGGALNKVDPAAIPGLITPWLNRAAKQQVVTPISNDAGASRFLSVMRSRAGAAAMFGNLANAVQQITGFSLASLKVRPSLMLSATADFAKHPKAFVAGVSEASPYMAERLDSEVAAMNDNINQILLNPTLLEKGQAWSMRHAYFLQTAIDSAMSPIIWTAAYNQALEQGHSHDDAVRLGDSAVRETQGSTLPEDISRIESGNAFVRLFTQFAGYFNMQANLLGTEYAKMIQQDYGLRKNASKGLFIFMMGFYVPAVVGELVMQLFKGGPGDDDKDGEYLDDWLAVLFGMAPLRTAIAMVPVAGQAINSAINAWNSKPYDDRIASSPAISMLESAAKAPVSVYNAVVNDGSAQKAVRDVATLISMTVGIPVNLAARPIGYAVGVADNKITPTSGPDMARGLVTGIASPDSKR